MLFAPRLVFVLAVAMALVACESPQRRAPAPTLPPPSDTTSPAGGAATETPPAAGSTYGTSNTGGTYPYGSATGASDSDQPLILHGDSPPSRGGPTTSEDSPVVRSPDGSTWSKPGTDPAQAQADTEACFSFASAQVRNDQRIIDDRDSATLNSSSRMTSFRRNMGGFDQRRRLRSLMDSCMAGKGYLRL